VPSEEVLVGADQERSRNRSGVEDLEFGGLLRGLAFEQVADRGLDDVVHDVGGGVIDAAGLLTSGSPSTTARWPSVRRMTLPRIARKPGEDLGWQLREHIGRLGIVEVLDDVPEELGRLCRGRG